MKKIFNNQFYSFLAYGSQFGFAFLSFMVLIRALSVEDLGVWILYMTLLTIAEQARNGLIQNGYIRFLKTGEFNIDILKASAFRLSILSGMALSLVVVIVSIPFAWITNSKDLLYLALTYPVFAFISSILRFREFHWMGTGKFFGIAFIKSFYGAGFLFILLICWKFNYLNLLLLPAYQIMVLTITLASTKIFKGGSVSLKKSSNHCIKELISFGRYVLGTNIGSIILNKTDVFILGILMGPVGIAFYNAASKLINVIEIPLTSISQVVFPKISNAYQSQSHTTTGGLIERSAKLILIVMIPLSMLLAIFAEPVITLIAGEEYASSAIVLQILACSAIIKSIGRVFGISLDAIGKPHWNYYLVFASVFINVSLNFILYPFLGITGIALSTFISTSTGTIMALHFLKKDIPIRFMSIINPGIRPFNLFNKNKNYETSLRS